MNAESPTAAPSRRRILGVFALLVALLVVDLCRAPTRQWSAKALIGAIHVYQQTLSRVLRSMGVSCRFETSCSRYAEAAIRADGAALGTARALGRLVRCGPWTPRGTADPG